MAQYILINNGDENISYSIDTDEERVTARAALTTADLTSAAIYVGDPEDPSSYATGERFATELGALDALCLGHDMGEERLKRLAKAISLGATQKSLVALRDALRTSMSSTIVLPRHRLENMSRGKGWCRKGRGNNVTWGERVDGGYEVGPGKWTVGGNDGFSRKGETTWDVANVTVGTEIWTVAT